MRINKTIFKDLYKNSDGAPNASARVLVAMTILKEGQGWSDEQMFENCNYNLLFRGALGLMNLDDAPPVALTYYLFRKRLVEYNKVVYRSTKAEIDARFIALGKHYRNLR